MGYRSKEFMYSEFCNNYPNNTSDDLTFLYTSDEVSWAFIFCVLVIATVGLIGNTAISVLFLKMNNPANFHRIMTVLGVCDNLSIIIVLAMLIIPNLIKSDENISQIIEKENMMIPIGYPILETALTGSILFTLLVSIERYLIVCRPFYAIARQWPISYYNISITIFCVVYNLPRYYELKTIECENGKIAKVDICSNDTSLWRRSLINENHNCSIRNNMLAFGALGCSGTYFLYYRIVLDSIVRWIVPFLLMIVMNCLIIQNVRKRPLIAISRRESRLDPFVMVTETTLPPISNGISLVTEEKEMFRKDIKLALASMVMVSIFVLCHSVIWIPRFYEHVNGEEANICKMRKHVLIGYFFTTIYSSIKCCAYFLTRYRLTSSLRSFVRKILDCYNN